MFSIHVGIRNIVKSKDQLWEGGRRGGKEGGKGGRIATSHYELENVFGEF